jgi:hypothetical protein
MQADRWTTILHVRNSSVSKAMLDCCQPLKHGLPAGGAASWIGERQARGIKKRRDGKWQKHRIIPKMLSLVVACSGRLSPSLV